MAKYNAIYEGRLPHAIYSRISEQDITYHRGLIESLLELFDKVYKRYLFIFKK